MLTLDSIFCIIYTFYYNKSFKYISLYNGSPLNNSLEVPQIVRERADCILFLSNIA